MFRILLFFAFSINYSYATICPKIEEDYLHLSQFVDNSTTIVVCKIIKRNKNLTLKVYDKLSGDNVDSAFRKSLRKSITNLYGVDTNMVYLIYHSEDYGVNGCLSKSFDIRDSYYMAGFRALSWPEPGQQNNWGEYQNEYNYWLNRRSKAILVQLEIEKIRNLIQERNMENLEKFNQIISVIGLFILIALLIVIYKMKSMLS